MAPSSKNAPAATHGHRRKTRSLTATLSACRESDAEHVVAGRGAPAGDCRARFRAAPLEAVDRARARARAADSRLPDRLGQRAGARPLRAGLRSTRALPDRGARHTRLPHAGAVRVLGARGVSAADHAVSAGALPDAVGPR